MPNQTRVVSAGPDDRSVRMANGEVLRPPPDWVLVPPGDPALTRRIRAAGPTWSVQEKKGRKVFSLGVWTLKTTVESIRAQLAAERADPKYAKRLEVGAQRREKEQAEYVRTFEHAVLEYLTFDPRHEELARQLARAVTEHATPVGSGTVARTERIPVDERAEAAVIAWMRHRTTAYDHMIIPRVKGKRREVRRMLAGRSKALLDAYRTRGASTPADCPLRRALTEAASQSGNCSGEPSARA